MRLYGPTDSTEIDLKVLDISGYLVSLPASFTIRLISLGVRLNFSVAMIGMNIDLGDVTIRVTRTHYEEIRIALEKIGAIKKGGQGLPTRVLFFGPVLRFLDDKSDWSNWLIASGSTRGPRDIPNPLWNRTLGKVVDNRFLNRGVDQSKVNVA